MWPLNFPVNWNNIKICHFLSPCFALFFVALTNFLIMRVYSNKQASIHNLALSFAYPFPFQPFIQLLSLFLSLLVTSFSFSIFLFLLPLLFSFRFKLSLFSIPYFWFPFSPSNTCKLIQRFSFLQPLSLFFFPPFYVCVYHPPPAAPHSCPNISTVTPTSRRFCFKCPVEFNSKFSWFLLGIPSECAKSLHCISHLPASSLYPLQATFSKPAKNASDYPDQLPFQRPTWKSALCTLAQMPLVHYSHGGLQKFAAF